MKTRIGLCILMGGFVLVVMSSGGHSAVEALRASVETRETSKTTVPNVSGVPSDIAMQILEMAGLHGTIQRGASSSLTVADQRPRAGTLAALGSEVVLALGDADIAQEKPVTSSSETPLTLLSEDVRQVHDTISTAESAAREQQIIYFKERQDVETAPVWFPKRLFSTQQTTSQTSQSVPSILSSQGNGRLNVLGGVPLNAASGDRVPIIMLRTEGWQYGWIPSGSYTPSQPGSSYGDSGTRIQSRADTLVSVPSVWRLSLSDAEIALKKAGLAIGTITQIEDYHQRSGLVLEQSPAAKTRVPQGTAVDLRVMR